MEASDVGSTNEDVVCLELAVDDRYCMQFVCLCIWDLDKFLESGFLRVTRDVKPLSVQSPTHQKLCS